jgi:hypothetical protein
MLNRYATENYSMHRHRRISLPALCSIQQAGVPQVRYEALTHSPVYPYIALQSVHRAANIAVLDLQDNDA